MTMNDAAYQQFTQRIGIGEAEKKLESKIQTIAEKRENEKIEAKINDTKDKINDTKNNLNDKIEQLERTIQDDIEDLREGHKENRIVVKKIGSDMDKIGALVKVYVDLTKQLRLEQERYPTITYTPIDVAREEEQKRRRKATKRRKT